MNTLKGNIFDFKGDAICITTNGIVKSNGDAVMGAGIALQAAQIYPQLPKKLGSLLKEHGNHVAVLMELENEPAIIAFPTKEELGVLSLER